MTGTISSEVRPTLGRDEIHVWTVELESSSDDQNAGCTEWLTSAERAQAERFSSDQETSRFVRRRAALRVILARYLGVSPRDIVFSVNAYGKPSVLAPKTATALVFNTSHSGMLALIAVGRSLKIGIDLERLRPDIEDEAVASRFFAADELAALAALDPGERIAGFFNAWTRKEAVVKALGKGLSIPLDSFEVTLRPGEPAQIVRWNVQGASSKGWRIHHLEPADGYIGALAVDSATARCQLLSWQG